MPRQSAHDVLDPRSRARWGRVLLWVVVLALVPATASTQYATGGAGRFLNNIIWLSWGNFGDAVPDAGKTVTNRFQVGGQELAVTCRLSTIRDDHPGQGQDALKVYSPGMWQGDGLDELYNIGGTGAANRMNIGLTNARPGSTVGFDLLCSATLGGSPFELAGLVFADAEQSGNPEYVQATITDANGHQFRIIDRYRSSGCSAATNAQLTTANSQLTLKLAGTSACSPAGPTVVAFMERVTSARIEIRGGGASAVALGVALANSDYGDAPASYGSAQQVQQIAWTGGTLVNGNNDPFASGFALANIAIPALTLGQSVDGEPQARSSADASGDDTDGADDEDALTVPRGGLATPVLVPGTPYSMSQIVCRGGGYVAGWIDFNRNGVFDPSERSNVAPQCPASGQTSLGWIAPSDIQSGPSFMRLRTASTAGNVNSPTGVFPDGEVEDHPIVVARARLALAKQVTGVVALNDQFVVTVAQGSLGTAVTGTNVSTGPVALNPGTPVTLSEAMAPGSASALSSYVGYIYCANVGRGGILPVSGAYPSWSVTLVDGADLQCSITNQPNAADLSITNTDAADPVAAGGTMTYTLTVTNAGPFAAQSLTVTDTLPTGSTFVSATGSGWTCAHAAGVVTCTRSSLGVAPAPAITIKATAPTTPGTVTNTATVSAAQVDQSPANNTATQTTVVSAATLTATLTATDVNGGSLLPTETVEFTLTVANTSAFTASGLVATIPLPSSLRYVSGSLSVVSGANAGTKTDAVDGDQAEHSGTNVVVRLGLGATGTTGGTLSTGQSTSVTFRATVAPSQVGNISVQGAVASTLNAVARTDQTDGDPVTAGAQPTVLTVAASADLVVSKGSSTTASVLVGGAATWGILVRNGGPGASTGVVLTATFPAQVTGLSADQGGSLANLTVTWPPFDLAAGASREFTVHATAPASPLPGGASSLSLPAIATATPGATSAPDPRQDNNSNVRVAFAVYEPSQTGLETPLFSTLAPGGVVATGNSLGLGRAGSSDVPGEVEKVGAFTTTDTTKQKSAAWPFGTTGDWREGRSAAVLRLPAGARVLRAQLVWAARCSATGVDVRADIDSPVTLVTPGASAAQDVAPNPAWSKTNTSGECSYMRTADVTSLVQAAGAGTYTVGRIPAALSNGTGTASGTYGGWTLLVAYRDDAQPVRSLSIFTGLMTVSGSTPDVLLNATVTGFCTPPGTQQRGRLTVAGIDGQAWNATDSVRFGPALPLTDANRLSGPYRFENNFFEGVIEDEQGQIDTTGTFGTRNNKPGVPVTGARCTYDLASVDVSPFLTANQQSAVIGARSAGDVYYLKALGLQVDVGAPRIVATNLLTANRTSANVGDVVTYQFTLGNTGDRAAERVVARASLPPGMTYVPGSFTRDGSAVSGADPTGSAGVPLGDIAAASTTLLSWQFRVTAVPAAPAPASFSSNATFSYDFQGCAGQPTKSETFTTNTVLVVAPRVSVTLLMPAAALPDNLIPVLASVSNSGTAPTSGTTLAVPVPGGLTYVPGSTTLNGVPVPDVGGLMPFSGPAPINSAGQASGVIAPSQQAVIQFGVRVARSTVGAVVTTATADPDGAGSAAAVAASATTTVTAFADVRLAISAPATATVGSTLQFTTVVTNNGPSTATGVALSGTTPTGLTFVSNSGACSTAFPCALGTLADGASVTVVATYSVPPAYTTPDPIVGAFSVTNAVSDPLLANNVGLSAVSVNAPVTDLSVSATNGVTSVIAGTDTTYTVIVRNDGPAQATGARVQSVLPADLTNATWTCAGTAGTACGAAGGTGALDTTLTIPPTGQVTITLTGRVAANALTRSGATGTLPVHVFTTTASGASDPTPASDTDTDTIGARADVGVSISGPTSIVPGTTTVPYSLTVRNLGPSDATNVQLETTFPAGLSLVSLTGCPTTTFPCSLGTIAAGQTVTVTAQVSVPSDYTTPDPVVFSSRVSTTVPDPVSGNDTASASSPLARQTDVAVGGYFWPNAVPVGQPTELLVWVYNVGPAGTGGVEVSVPIPAGLSVSGNTPSQGSYSAATGMWTVGTMNPGDLQTLSFSLSPTVSGPISVAITETSGGIDTRPSDDAATATLNAIAANDLQVEITADRLTPNVGEQVTLTVKVTNAGPSPATNVLIAVPPPAGLTLGAPVPSGSTSWAPGTWTIPTLAVNGAETLTIVATVDAAGAIGVRAEYLSSNELELSPANNTSSVIINGGLSADVQVTKQVSKASPSVGEQVTYTLVVRNNGPSPATGVQVTDILNGNLSFASAIASAGAYDSGTGVWTVGDLSATQQETLAITVTVNAAGATPNTATKTAMNEPDPIAANDTASVSLSAGLTADLQITKTGPASITAGQPISYVITATNAGPSPVTGALVTDPLSALLSGATWTCTASGGASTCSTASGSGPVSALVNLAAGATATITVHATVSSSAATAGNPAVDNAASISPPRSVQDPTTSNNRATASVPLGTSTVDVSVASFTGPTTLLAGSSGTFTVTIANSGPADAVDAQLVFTAPTGFLVSGPASSVCAGPFPCLLPAIPAGGSISVAVTVAVPAAVSAGAGGPVMLTASVVPSATEIDADATNDTSSLMAYVETSADRAVTARFLTPTAGIGTTVDLEVTFRNLGPAAAAGARVSVPVTSGFSFVSATVTRGTYNAITGTWDVGTMASGETLTLVSKLRVTAAGPLAVHVTRTGAGKDPNKANDTTTASLNGTSTADLGVSVTADRTSLIAGETASVGVAVANAGPDVAQAIVVHVSIPAGLTVTSQTPGQGSFDASTGLWTIGDLAAGAAAHLSLQVRVDADGAYIVEGRVDSTAASTVQVNPANDRDAISLNGLTSADIEVTKDVSATTVLPGSSVTYTVRAHNHGPAVATGVKVQDILPPGLTLASAKASQGTYDPASGIWTVGTLGVTDTAVLVVTAGVDPAAAGALINTARLAASSLADTDASNDEATQVVVISPPISLGISSFVGAGNPVVPGAPIEYTLWLGSAGAVPGPTTVTLYLPSAFGYVSGPAGWTCSPSSGQVTCVAGTFDPASGPLVFQARVVSPLPDGTATSVVVSNPLDTTLGDNGSSFYFSGASGQGGPDVDLRVTAAVDNGVVDAGCAAAPAALTVRVANVGQNPATNVAVVGDLPSVSVLSASSSRGQCAVADRLLFCVLGDLAPGSVETVTVNVVASAPGTPVFNVAAVSVGAATEVTPLDNFASATFLARSLDSDSDGMPDAWERKFGLNPLDGSDAGLDPDNDGLTNLAEYQSCSHPNGAVTSLLPEGVVNDLFSTRVVLFNPGTTAATALLRALPEGAQGVPVVYQVAPHQRLELDGRQYAGIPPVAFGTMVESDQSIVVERTTTWDVAHYGAQGDNAITTPSTTWYFAEGATGPFGLFYLLANPGTQDAVVEATFLKTAANPAPIQVTVPARQRLTVWVNQLPDMSQAHAGATFRVLSGPAIGVSRAMYMDDAQGRFFGVGHSANGAPAPATHHVLPEGAAGFFDLFYLLANPEASQDANVRLTFGLEDGTTVTQDVVVGAGNRVDVWVNALAATSTDPLVQRLGSSAMTTTVESLNGVPIVAERAMYWPAGAWQDGTAGGPQAALPGPRWGVANAEVGGAHQADTFLLVGNTAAQSGSVRATLYFDDGTTATREFPITASGRLTIWLNVSFPEANGRKFGAVVESVDGVMPIAVERSTYGSDANGVAWATGVTVPATRLP